MSHRNPVQIMLGISGISPDIMARASVLSKKISRFTDIYEDDIFDDALLTKIVIADWSAFSDIPTHKRTRALCHAVLEHDVTLIRQVFRDFVTEEQLYRAVKINADYASSFDQLDLFSRRVIDILVSVSPEATDLVPRAFLTTDDLIRCLKLHGKAPIEDFDNYNYRIKTIDFMVAVLEDNLQSTREIQGWKDMIECFADPVFAKKSLNDEFETDQNKYFAFLALGLHTKEGATRHLNDMDLIDLILDHHDGKELVRYASASVKKRIISSDMDI